MLIEKKMIILKKKGNPTFSTLPNCVTFSHFLLIVLSAMLFSMHILHTNISIVLSTKAIYKMYSKMHFNFYNTGNLINNF